MNKYLILFSLSFFIVNCSASDKDFCKNIEYFSKKNITSLLSNGKFSSETKLVALPKNWNEEATMLYEIGVKGPSAYQAKSILYQIFKNKNLISSSKSYPLNSYNKTAKISDINFLEIVKAYTKPFVIKLSITLDGKSAKNCSQDIFISEKD